MILEKIRNMIHRNREINPFPVSDRVTFRNVDQTITLTVRTDASSIVAGLRAVNVKLSKMTAETPEEERVAWAREMATVIFGAKQADALMTFYDENPLAVINACGLYFQHRLSNKLTKAQKK